MDRYSSDWTITDTKGATVYHSSADHYIADKWPHLTSEDRRLLYQTAKARHASITETYHDLTEAGQLTMKDDDPCVTHTETGDISIEMLDSGYIVDVQNVEVYDTGYKRRYNNTRHALTTKAQLLKFLEKQL